MHVILRCCCMMQATDIAMLADMARYMRNDYSSLGGGYSAANFPHANIPSMYWWDWNANSGDTGGLVRDDWLTVRLTAELTSFDHLIRTVWFLCRLSYLHDQ